MLEHGEYLLRKYERDGSGYAPAARCCICGAIVWDETGEAICDRCMEEMEDGRRS